MFNWLPLQMVACSQSDKKKNRGDIKTKLNMEKKNLFESITYRMERYKAMGNGTMCQRLMRELEKLQNSASAPRAALS